MRKRWNHDAAFKAWSVLESLKGERTVWKLAAAYGVDPTMTRQHSISFLEGAVDIFERGGKPASAYINEDRARVTCMPRSESWQSPITFCRKAQAMDREVRRRMIERDHPAMSIATRCRVTSISRSPFYHYPSGETDRNLSPLRLIDKQFLETPF